MACNLNHPEILSVEKLREILLSRSIPSKDVINKDKNDLVQLFYRYIVPLPQRKVHRRRGSRVNSRNMTGVCNSTTAVDQSNSNESECCSRGIKRKSNILEMEKISATNDVSNCLHDHISATTDCANKITKLSVNCLLSKPLKLNRECLSRNSATKPKIPNLSTERNFALITKPLPKVTNKNNSQNITEEKEQRPAKKFKRITVTWP